MEIVNVKRKTSFGDYEYVQLRLHHTITEEKHGFPPHKSWSVQNGDSWHFENLTQFLDEPFEKFLKRNEMEVI